MTGRVCVVGSLIMDLALRAPRRPGPGETVVGTSFEMFLGGKGFNQAVAAARCGAQTSMIGRLGDDDFGRQFLAQLARDGIDHRHVSIDPVEGTGIGVPLVEESGENSIVIVTRANARLTPEHIADAADAITSADVLLLQLELSIDVAVAAARIARDAGVKVVLNPAPASGGIEPLHGLIDVLVPNEPEARSLAGTPVADDGPTPALVLRDRLGGAIVMTIGKRGCVLVDGGGLVSVPAHPVDVVDTVGAGDAFCGALGHWLSLGATMVDAVVHANAAGALAVTRPGAEPSMPAIDSIVRLVASRPVSASEPAGKQDRM